MGRGMLVFGDDGLVIGCVCDVLATPWVMPYLLPASHQWAATVHSTL